MYSYIKGTLVQSTPSFVVIDNQGIGYKIFIPASVFSKLPSLQDAVVLHVSFIVRELSQTLYGFNSVEDRDLFEALLNVTGVGPKMAINITGHLTGQELYLAIQNHDINTVSKVPGVGKKTAERLILEMREKIHSFADPSTFTVQMPSEPKAQIVSDAMGALINLGYTQGVAQKAIKTTLKSMGDSITLSDLITASLKNI